MFAELTPVSDHWTSFSGGLSDRINHLTASAPYWSIIASGSTVFFFDLDIDSDGPTKTLDLSAFFKTFLSIFSISSGYKKFPFVSLYVSWQTIPWVNKFWKGSDISIFLLNLEIPFVKKREYKRCNIACSIPPMYWSTGIQYFICSSSNGDELCLGEQKRMKYHDESTNVSKVSVSLIAFFPVDFCVVFFHLGWFSKGFPFAFKSTSSGNSTGNSLLSTGTTDPSSR